MVADEAVVEMRVDDVARSVRRLAGGLQIADTHALQLGHEGADPAQRLRAGIRYMLPPQEGTGYWDIFSISNNLLISITDTVYRHDRWVPVDDSLYFKFRFMLSGRLLNRNHQTLLEGGQALANVAPRTTGSGGGYFVAAGLPTRMVVLHGRKELLTEALGFEPGSIPPPLHIMLDPAHEEITQKVSFGAKLFRAAQDIVDSRHELPPRLRTAYLEAKAFEMICQLLSELVNRDTAKRLDIRISARELNCIYEARDYLTQHFVAPPTISKLARMVGINQTKLKASFKQVLGMTIYHFIIKVRMERASELLLASEHSISEIAYLVGYDYPANFTYAFKKHFSVLPRAWKRRHKASDTPAREERAVS
jgi:AraC-like DNA-binding protein